MTTLDLTTIQVDDFSLIELTKREGGGFNLTLHVGSEESGRWDDLSIGLPASKAAALADALEQGVGVKPAAWQCEFFRADPSPRWHPELWLSDPRELYGNTLVRNVKPLYLAPSHPAAVAVTDEMVERALKAKGSQGYSVRSWMAALGGDGPKYTMRAALEAALVDRDRVKL